MAGVESEGMPSPEEIAELFPQIEESLRYAGNQRGVNPGAMQATMWHQAMNS